MTGWPWPLDGVQGWFEDLFDTIWDTLQPAFSWVVDTLRPIIDTISGGIEALWSWITSELGKIYTWMTTEIPKALKATGEWIVAQVQAAGEIISDMGGWLAKTIFGWVDGLARWLTDSFRWVADQVSSTGAWIKDQVVLALDGGFASLGSWLVEGIQGIGAALGVALQGFLEWFIGGLGSFAVMAGDFLNEWVLKPIHAGLSWVWEWIHGSITSVVQGIQGLIKSGSPMTPEEAFEISPKVMVLMGLSGLAASGITAVLGMKVMGTGIDASQIGEFLRDLINPSMVTGMILGTLLGVGIRTPLTYYYNKAFTPNIPRPEDLVTMAHRGAFPLEELEEPPEDYMAWIGYHGYSGPWAKGLWKISHQLLDVDVAREYYWRHPEAKDWYKGYLKSMAFGAEEREILEEISWMIPPIPDLIRFAVREAFPVATTEAQFEEMYGWIQAKGMTRWWGERYFESHWELPPLTRVFDAYARGVISRETFEKYAIILDYKPDPRPGMEASDVDIMLRTAYQLIPRVDLRRAWEAGVPGYEDLTPHYLKLGYSPEDAETEAALQVRVALSAEIGDMERLVERRFKAGYCTLEEAKANLESLGFHPMRIEARIQYYTLLAETEHADSDLSEIDTAFSKEIVSWGDVEAVAEKYITRVEARDDWLDQVFFKRYKKARPEAVKEAPLRKQIRELEEKIAAQELKVRGLATDLEDLRSVAKETLDTYDVQIMAVEEDLAALRGA